MTKLATASSTDLVLKVETQDMSPAQVRLLRQVHSLLVHTLTAEDESEYFEASAQLLQQAVKLVEASNFPTERRDGIPYGEQAVEYAVESLNECLSGRSRTLDN